MKKLFARLLILVFVLNPVLLVPPVHAEAWKTPVVLSQYMDYDSGTATYCRTNGLITGTGTIKTSGSSPNVTENVASTNPFRDLKVNDVIVVDRTPNNIFDDVDIAFIITRTDAANVVVNPSVDWSSGYVWKYYDQDCGTAATDGWTDTSGISDATWSFTIHQMNATSIGMRIECKGLHLGSGINVVYPNESSNCGDGTLTSGYCVFTAIGSHDVFMPEQHSRCRVAVQVNTDDGGDLTTNSERITIGFSARVRQ